MSEHHNRHVGAGIVRGEMIVPGRGGARGPRSVANRSVLVLAITVAIAACGDAADDVEPDALPLSTLVRELRIGSPDDPDYAFGTVISLAVGSEGEIYSIHQREAAIRRWRPDGTPLGAIGRAGDGPGEMRTPRMLGWRGDSLWVFDSRSSRITFFTADGRYLDGLTPVVDLGTVELAQQAIYPPRPAGLLGDGSIHGISSVPSDEIVRGRITQIAHVRMDAAGAVTDTLAVLPFGVESVLGVLQGVGGTFTQQPFGDGVLSTVARDGHGLLIVERKAATSAGQADFRVTRLDLGGDTVFSRAYPYRPIPIPAERVDSAITTIAGQLQEFVGERMGTTAAQWRGWIGEAAYTPDYHAPVSEFVAGRDGTIWLALHPPDVQGTDWLVLDEDGDPVGRVLVPPGLRVLLADREKVWGVETDELDVPYIVRYGVTADRG